MGSFWRKLLGPRSGARNEARRVNESITQEQWLAGWDERHPDGECGHASAVALASAPDTSPGPWSGPDAKCRSVSVRDLCEWSSILTAARAFRWDFSLKKSDPMN